MSYLARPHPIFRITPASNKPSNLINRISDLELKTAFAQIVKSSVKTMATKTKIESTIVVNKNHKILIEASQSITPKSKILSKPTLK